MTVDDILAEGSRALRERTSRTLDVDRALADTLARTPQERSTQPPSDRRGSVLVRVAAAVVLVAVVAGGLWSRSTAPGPERVVPASTPLIEPISTTPTTSRSATTAPSAIVADDDRRRGVDALRDDFSATAAFTAMPASMDLMGERVDGTNERLVITAADLAAVERVTGWPRPAAGDDADAWVAAMYGLDAAAGGVSGLALHATPFPGIGSGNASSTQRRDELGFDLVNTDAYAMAYSAPWGGHLGVFVGEDVVLGDGFIELGDDVYSLGTGDDYHRDVDQISPVRSLGAPLRALGDDGFVVLGSSMGDVTTWRGGRDRLVDDPRAAAAARALDASGDLVEVTAYLMDFRFVDGSFAADEVLITEPFSILAVGTVVDDGTFSTVVSYVFDSPTVATAMRDLVDAAWHRPSPATGAVIADLYTSVAVEAVGRTVVVTAPLKPTTSTTHWLGFLFRAEPVFAHR